MKKIFVLICFSFLISTTGFTQENAPDSWIYVTSAIKDSTQRYFIRNEAVSVKGSSIKVWTKAFYKKTEVAGKKFKNCDVQTLYLFDCAEQTLSVIKVVYFDSKGNVLLNADGHTEPIAVLPESVGYSLMKKAWELFGEKN